MKNFISINGRHIELSEEQAKQIADAYCVQQKQLSDCAVGSTVKIGEFEMVVLDQNGGQTALILKGMYGEDSEFGVENNNYNDSYVDHKCQKFAQELSEVVGWDNIMLHAVDLTSDDGLDDYGVVERRASLITTDMYRKFVKILDTCNPKCWWWMATPHSTKCHENDAWVKCVSPAGRIGIDFFSGGIGVRPFCILKSTIFVSD